MNGTTTATLLAQVIVNEGLRNVAAGANPIAIVVPCHRVVGADGRLTGYAGGTDRKRTLLDLERGILPLA